MGGEPKAGSQKRSHCVLMEIQRGAQCIYLSGKMVVGCSFIPSVALLMCPSGTVHPTVMNSLGHKHDASKSRPSSVNDVPG